MNTSDSASKPASQSTTSLSQSLPGAGVPTLPLAGAGLPTLPLLGAGVPTFNYAIALQQYHFQQSLANQQLLAQQQAVAHAVSIKAAAEQAAARAAEISKLLKGENNYVSQGKAKDSAPKRESSESNSRSSSPHSSKSKSVSPVRPRGSRLEREEYSPRDRRSYRTRRHPSYYNRYDRDYSRTSYRRDADRSSGRSYLYHHRSRSRSRRRSPSRSWSKRYRHDDSRSPRHRRIRSPSPKSGRRMSPRVSNRRSMSRSPINDSSISPNPQRSRIVTPRSPMLRRSISSSETSPSCSMTSLVAKDDRVDHDISSRENNNASETDFKQRGKEARPLVEQLERSESSKSRSRRSTSSDYSGKRITQEPSFKKAVSSKFTGADEDDSRSPCSDGGSVRRASDMSDNESDSTASALPRSTDHWEPPRVNRHSPSPEYSLSDHGGQGKYSYEEEENTGAEEYVARELRPSKTLNRGKHELPPKVISSNEGSAHSADEEIYGGTKVKSSYRTCSEDMITVEDDVNDKNHPTNQGDSSHGVEILGCPNIPGECAIYPLPEPPESMDGKLSDHKSPEKLNKEQQDDVNSPVIVPDGAAKVDTAEISMSPDAYQYQDRRSKQGSRSRDRKRKHSKRHHKKHHREESEEDDNKKESRKELKLKRHERKSRRRRHKSRKEGTRRKRKHRDTSSSSSSDDSFSSSDDVEYRKEHHDVTNKRSTGSRKKRRHASSASTSSSY